MATDASNERLKVIREAETLIVSNRDRDRLLKALDDTGAKPNPALLRAAERYKTAIGQPFSATSSAEPSLP